MATAFHNIVDLRGTYFEDSMFTFNLDSGIVVADIGKPVTIDTAGQNKVKIAGSGNPIFGVLATVEDRTVEGIKVGTVSRRFIQEFPVLSADSLAVGGSAVGSTISGEIKAGSGDNVVIALNAGRAVVMRT